MFGAKDPEQVNTMAKQAGEVSDEDDWKLNYLYYKIKKMDFILL